MPPIKSDKRVERPFKDGVTPPSQAARTSITDSTNPGEVPVEAGGPTPQNVDRNNMISRSSSIMRGRSAYRDQGNNHGQDDGFNTAASSGTQNYVYQQNAQHQYHGTDQNTVRTFMECFAEQTKRSEMAQKQIEQLRQEYNDKLHHTLTHTTEAAQNELGQQLAKQFNDQLSILNNIMETNNQTHQQEVGTLIHELTEKFNAQDQATWNMTQQVNQIPRIQSTLTHLIQAQDQLNASMTNMTRMTGRLEEQERTLAQLSVSIRNNHDAMNQSISSLARQITSSYPRNTGTNDESRPRNALPDVRNIPWGRTDPEPTRRPSAATFAQGRTPSQEITPGPNVRTPNWSQNEQEPPRNPGNDSPRDPPRNRLREDQQETPVVYQLSLDKPPGFRADSFATW